MAKRQKKKRHKQYRGEDAAVTKKTVTRYQAQERSALGEWWENNRTTVILRGLSIGLAGLVALVLWGLYVLIA